MKTKQNLIQICLIVALLIMQVFICGAQPVVTNIAAGLYHSLFIMSDGSLWSMGENGFGQLGIGNDNSTNLPVKVVTNGVVAIAGGGFHTLFVKSDGSLWAMGDNQYGELGDATLNTTNLPEMILPGGVKAVAAGVYHSLILKTDSSLWGMGYNHDGQLGDGSFGPLNQTNRPEYIATNVIAITAGNYHSLFQKSDGSLWGMGKNDASQLGTGNTVSVHTPIEITNSVFGFAAGGNHSLFFYNDPNNPNLWAMGDNSYGEFGNGTDNNSSSPESIDITVGVFENITPGNLVTGSDHTLYLEGDDNALWAVGRNDYGELGNGSYNTTDNPVAGYLDWIGSLAAGAYHSMCLQYDGSLWLMGNNGGGELGDGTLNNVNTPNLIVPGNLVVNGGFETGDFSGWTLTVPGHSDTVVSAIRPPDRAQYSHSGMFAAQFSDIFLGGLGGSTESVIAQTLPTQPGTSYLISFWLDGITDSSFSVSWNGNTLDTTSIAVNNNFNYGWIHLQFVVKTTGNNGVLQFQFPGIFNHQATTTALDDVSVVPLPAGYNQINAQLLNGGNVRLSFFGLSPVLNTPILDLGNLFHSNFYALDRTFNLATPDWVPQATNSAAAGGEGIFTNTPVPTTNNFWRIRSVP
jgi:alpha-tubulin suppressor-like RCC1 family protein